MAVELNDTTANTFSETDASNTSAAPDGAPAGTVPSAAEGIWRGLMATLKRFWDRINGKITTTGASTHYIYTPANTSYPTAYSKGEVFTWWAHQDSAGSDDFNLNSLGVKSLKKFTASGKVALAAGDIKNGMRIVSTYDGTDVIVENPVISAAGNMTNTGASVANQIPKYTDTTGTALAPGFTVGTSGAVIPLLNTANTISGVETHTAGVIGAVVALTDGATVTPDLATANNLFWLIGGNRTLAVPANPVAGTSLEIDIRQDTTGSRTLTAAWIYTWAGGSAGVLSTPGCSFDRLFGTVAYYGTSVVTMTIAAPGVVTWTGHGLHTGCRLQLTTTGALPTGLSASTTYFVTKIDANTFKLSTSLVNCAAGTFITTTGSQSGVHTAVAGDIGLSLNKAFA